LRGGAARSNLQTFTQINPTELTPRLSCARPHTGDFEELRNFGMCWTRSVGFVCGAWNRKARGDGRSAHGTGELGMEL